jgi:hypothetical protein
MKNSGLKNLHALCATLFCAAVLSPVSVLSAPKTKIDTPTLTEASSSQVSIFVSVCAGATGLPGGFSLQWMTAADLAEAGGVWPTADVDELGNLLYCKASFSGKANLGTYNLGPGACKTVEIGDTLFDQNGASSTCPKTPLECGTDYAFRGFGHAIKQLQRSDFAYLSGTTGDCSASNCRLSLFPYTGACTNTQGYWGTHGFTPTGNNSNEWTFTTLTLGSVSTYTQEDIQKILDSPGGGNGLVILAHQLITARINILQGAPDTDIAADIAAADGLIGGMVVPYNANTGPGPIVWSNSNTLSTASTSSLVSKLTAFNEGGYYDALGNLVQEVGPGHCNGYCPIPN